MVVLDTEVGFGVPVMVEGSVVGLMVVIGVLVL